MTHNFSVTITIILQNHLQKKKERIQNTFSQTSHTPPGTKIQKNVSELNNMSIVQQRPMEINC